jgi:hypothetical protein
MAGEGESALMDLQNTQQPGQNNTGNIKLAFVLNLGFTILEVFGGLMINSGEVRFFTDFGYDLPLRPEGWQMGAVGATADEQTWGNVTVFCGNHVRAWLFDLEGNAVGLIPSQYENGDGVFTPYAEDYGVGGPEYGYLEAAPPLYTGRYEDVFAGE